MRFFDRLLKILFYFYINIIRLFRLTDLYQPTYNPKKLFFIKNRFNRRNCEDRISAIEKSVDFKKIGSYLDIGSALGYFVFRLSDLVDIRLAQGIEMDDIAHNYANSLKFLNDKKNTSFINTKITPDFISKIPVYDMISLLNVFHHIVYFQGFEAADKIMRELYRKCNSYFIFETGQFNEKGYYWTESLAFMGVDPESWIEQYLRNIGYKEVVLAGKFKNHLNDVKRVFYVCSK